MDLKVIPAKQLTSEHTPADLNDTVRDWLSHFPGNLPVVAVPVYNAYEEVIACLDSLLAATPAHIPLLLIDDASTDRRIPDRFSLPDPSRRTAYVRCPTNRGFVSTVNSAFSWCAPRDVVVVNSDVIVPPGWLERLQEAAYSHPNAATATTLTNDGTILSVPFRNTPAPDLPGSMALVEVDARIQAHSLKLRPMIPTAVGHCVYFRRAALDAVGYFDEVFSPGYGEEVDFSLRAAAAGFCHVAADDVFVFHKGAGSFGLNGKQAKLRLREAHAHIINARYPWYRSAVVKAANKVDSPLAFAIERARAALLGYRIAIDATGADGATPRQGQAEKLVKALAGRPDRAYHLALVVGDQTSPESPGSAGQWADEVTSISSLQRSGRPPYDLIHRAGGIEDAAGLAFLQRAASRFIISWPGGAYTHPGDASPADHHRLTQLAFGLADGVAFSSSRAAQEAVSQGLQAPVERTGVIPLEDGAPAETGEKIWSFYRKILDMPPRSRQLTRIPRGRRPGLLERPAEFWDSYIRPALSLWRSKGFRPFLFEAREYAGWRAFQIEFVRNWWLKRNGY